MNEKEMHLAITNAQHTADRAEMSISSHEKLCTLRYENIQKSQEASEKKIDNIGDELIPEIFKMIGGLNKILYVGMGIFTGVPVIMAFCYGLWQFVKGH